MPIVQKIEEFVENIKKLRSEKEGCPWMKRHTHESLIPYLIEEAYEAIQEIRSNNPKELCDELGDLLLQIVLHSEIASESHRFSIENVIDAINQKMIRRNPHVFTTPTQLSIDEIKKQWDTIKMNEQSSVSKTEIDKLYATGPANTQNLKIGKFANQNYFDWDHPVEVLKKVKEELLEVEEAMQTDDRTHLQEELGDLYFAIGQLCRHLQFDPEETARKGNEKFLKRFSQLQILAEKKQVQFTPHNRKTLESLWGEVKKNNTSI